MSGFSQLKGVAIVTGSARGIGEAIALRLAEDGYDLALNDIPANRGALESVAVQARNKGRRVIVCVGDVSVEGDVKKLVGSTVGNFGGVDVVSEFFNIKLFIHSMASSICGVYLLELLCRWSPTPESSNRIHS